MQEYIRLKNLVVWGDTTKLKETNVFNAIPTGFMDLSGKLAQENIRACWWSSDAQYKETAYSYSIGNMGEHNIRDKFYKKQGFNKISLIQTRIGESDYPETVYILDEN